MKLLETRWGSTDQTLARLGHGSAQYFDEESQRALADYLDRHAKDTRGAEAKLVSRAAARGDAALLSAVHDGLRRLALLRGPQPGPAEPARAVDRTLAAGRFTAHSLLRHEELTTGGDAGAEKGMGACMMGLCDSLTGPFAMHHRTDGASLWNISGAQPQQVLELGSALGHVLTVMHNGAHAIATPCLELAAWDLGARPFTSRSLGLAMGSSAMNDKACISLTAREDLFAACGCGGAKLWDTSRWPPEPTATLATDAENHFYHAVTLSPDGRTLAAQAHKTLAVTELQNGRPTGQPPVHIDISAYRVQFSADSNALIAGDHGAQTVTVYRRSAPGWAPLATIQNISFRAAAWHPRGDLLVFAGGRIDLLRFDGPQPVRRSCDVRTRIGGVSQGARFLDDATIVVSDSHEIAGIALK